MERTKPRILSRRAFLAATLSSLSIACSRLPIKDRREDPFVSFDKFDHCQPVTEDSSNVAKAIQESINRSIVNPETPPPEGFTNRSPVIKIEDISKDLRNSHETHAQALLIPVGYQEDEVDEQFRKFRVYLDRVFEDTDIQFPYLKKPQEIEIDPIDQLAMFKDRDSAEDLVRSIRKVHPVDIAVFVLNSPVHMGGYHGARFGRGDLAIASGNSIYTKYGLAHEIMHGLGLEDGNRAENLGHVIPSEALFFDEYSLPPRARESYERIRPPIVRAGGVCTVEGVQRPLYTFYNARVQRYNLMKSGPIEDDAIDQKLSRREKLFDPVQAEIMLQRGRELVFLR